MVIANGLNLNPISMIDKKNNCTWFNSRVSKLDARKKWIISSIAPKGAIIIDDGAKKALRSGKSLLAAGIKKISGKFNKGDHVKILDKKGNVVDLGKFPVDESGRKLLNTSELQFEYKEEAFNRNNLKTKGVESGFFNDIYKVSTEFEDYLKQEVHDPDNPKKTIKLKELFDKKTPKLNPYELFRNLPARIATAFNWEEKNHYHIFKGEYYYSKALKNIFIFFNFFDNLVK